MKIVEIIQLLIAIFLMGSILLQQKGVGLGSAWGGQGSFYHTRRGVEKLLFVTTVVLAALFFVVSIVNFIVY